MYRIRVHEYDLEWLGTQRSRLIPLPVEVGKEIIELSIQMTRLKCLRIENGRSYAGHYIRPIDGILRVDPCPLEPSHVAATPTLGSACFYCPEIYCDIGMVFLNMR